MECVVDREIEIILQKSTKMAAETYCKAFGAEITREFKNEDNTAYDHQVLSAGGVTGYEIRGIRKNGISY